MTDETLDGRITNAMQQLNGLAVAAIAAAAKTGSYC